MTDDTPTYSLEDARALAARGKRIIQMDAEAVRFVEYDGNFLRDFRKTSIEFDEDGVGKLSFIMLPLAERHADELFDDSHILRVAKAGHMLDAIRLHRLLHNSNLPTAKAAVELLLRSSGA